MAYIKIDKTNRITAASYDYHCGEGEVEVDIPAEITLDHIHEYLYVNGEFVHDPIVEPVVETATQLDRIEAQVAYTAMMTDTLLEV
jgi:hypothetical protein